MSPLLIPILALMIPIVAILGGVVIKPWFALQHRRMEIEADKVAEKAAQYAAQTERLEERVRVLERIVTDRGVDLASEIESLRDDAHGGRRGARLRIDGSAAGGALRA